MREPRPFAGRPGLSESPSPSQGSWVSHKIFGPFTERPGLPHRESWPLTVRLGLTQGSRPHKGRLGLTQGGLAHKCKTLGSWHPDSWPYQVGWASQREARSHREGTSPTGRRGLFDRGPGLSQGGWTYHKKAWPLGGRSSL